MAHLYEVGAHRKQYAGQHEQVQKQIVPHEVADLFNDLCQLFHIHVLPLFLTAEQTKRKKRADTLTRVINDDLRFWDNGSLCYPAMCATFPPAGSPHDRHMIPLCPFA